MVLSFGFEFCIFGFVILDGIVLGFWDVEKF